MSRDSEGFSSPAVPATVGAFSSAPTTTSAPAYVPRRRPHAQRGGNVVTSAAPNLRDNPTYVATELTFAQLVELYFAAHPCEHLQGAFKKWIGFFQFGDVSAWAMTAERLLVGSQYLREVQGYAVSTVNRDLSQLGTIYKWAVAQKMAPAGFISPTLGNSGRVEEEPRFVKPFEPHEWQRMRLLARNTRDPLFTAFVWLIMDTGARRGEITERHWNDFRLDDPEGPNIVLEATQTKTKRARRLYFSHETAALLRRLRPAEKYRDQLVFKSKRGVTPNSYRKPWVRLCTALGRPELHVHDMRHVLAADLLKAGKGMIPVSNLLGHSSLVLKRRYGHLDDKSVRDIQAPRLGLDKPLAAESGPVQAARERHAARQAAAPTPMAEAQRLALLAQDAAAAAAAAAAALAAAQEAMRVAMGGAPAPTGVAQP